MMRLMRLTLCVLAAASLMALAGCSNNGYSVRGGQNTTQTQGLTAGNWQFRGPFPIGSGNGYLAVSGSTVTLETALPAATPAFCNPGPQVTLTGSLTGNSLTLTSPPLTKGSSEVMTITGTAHNGTNIDASFQVTGAAPDDLCFGATGLFGASGPLSGSFVPSVTGTWNGTITETDNDPVSDLFIASYPVGVTANIAQAATPVFGVIPGYGYGTDYFPVTGTVTFTSSSCFPNGVALPVDSTTSYMVGDQVSLTVTNIDGVEVLLKNYVPSNEVSNGPDPYYSGTEGSMYLANSPNGAGATCGWFQWSGTITNP
jgi:hypothetical protein